MTGLSIFFLIVGITTIIVSSIVALCENDSAYMFLSLFSLIFFALAIPANYPKSTEKDVMDGKAIVIEENRVGINNGDTVYNYKTYYMKWRQEWEYGRKH